METKRFCSTCGAEIAAGSGFCSVCGAPVAQQAEAAPSPIQQYNMNLQKKSFLADKIDFKRTLLSNIIPLVCITLGVILFFVGVGVRIPSDYLSSYTVFEYVGGDAYNYIIEAGLRGGAIAGARAAKGIYIASGILLTAISALKLRIIAPENKND